MGRWLMLLTLVLTPIASWSAATFDVEYTDATGFGFYDTTPVAPEGDNLGSTLGEQRRLALEHSLDIFSKTLHSDVPIHIEAGFERYGGSAVSATLASAGPEWFNFNFPEAPLTNIAYPSALANKISGRDLSDASRGISDIVLTINADIDGTALGNSSFYYGLDDNVSILDIDFVTVISHELIHGLGFLSAIDPLTGHKFGCDVDSCRTNDIGDIFSHFMARMVNNQPQALLDMSQSQRLSAVTAEEQVVWTGAMTQVEATNLSGGTINGMPKIYTPSPVEIGSSLSHTDFSLQATELMQPAYSGALATTRVNLAMLSDLGWGDTSDLEVSIRRSSVTTEGNTVIVTLTNNGSQSVNNPSFRVASTLGELSNSDSQLSCTTITEQDLRCTLSSIAAKQTIEAGLLLAVSSTTSSTQAVALKATITGDILDTLPLNNEDNLAFNATVTESNQSVIVEGSTTGSTSSGSGSGSSGDTGNTSTPSTSTPNGTTLEVSQGGTTDSLWIVLAGLCAIARRKAKSR